MPSSYSPKLRLELIASGEQSNTWGNTTNINLGTLLEAAIAGYLQINTGFTANSYTLVSRNGADDESRNMIIDVTAGVSLSTAGTLIVPASSKMYIVKNATTGGYALTVKTPSGTGVAVTNGTTRVVFCDGTNVYTAVTSAKNFILDDAPSIASHATRKDYVDTLAATKLNLDGSLNMTGNLTLYGNPVNSLHAAPKQYIDTNFLSKVNASAQTMAGMFTLPRDTSGGDTAYTVATKGYADFLFNTAVNTVSANYVPNTRRLIAGTGITLSGGGGAGGTLTSDITINASGTTGVASVGVISPIANSGSSTNPIITIQAANSGQSGYLSASDWNTFNGKASTGYVQSAVSTGTANYLPLTGGVLSGSLTAKQYVLWDSGQSASRYFWTGYKTVSVPDYVPVPTLASYSTNGNLAGFVFGQLSNSGSTFAVRTVFSEGGNISFYPVSNTYFQGTVSVSGTKTFRIDHPIKEGYKLYHNCVEAPRNDLIYRGVVTLVNGSATVNLDAASYLSPGTFVALTQDAEVVSLHNQDGFGRVKSSAVQNGEFTIISEDVNSNDSITWVVMAVRADKDIIACELTDENGRLIPEHLEG